MPNISQHQSNTITKLLLIGHSGTGKTGSLISLAAEGYKLRILDLDNGLDIIKSYATDSNSTYLKQNPKIAENIEFVTLTDSKRNVNGRLVSSRATVWPRLISLLTHWKYSLSSDGTVSIPPKSDETLIDLGQPFSWGEDTILVLDSITAASKAALDYHLQLNGALNSTRTQNEGRRDIGAAQSLLKELFDTFKDEAMNVNIVAISHMTGVSESGYGPQSEEVKDKGEVITQFPSAIGRALSPHIPEYFNTVLHAKALGQRLVIMTKTTGEVCTKNTAPMKVAPQYPIETGLADYFRAVRGK